MSHHHHSAEDSVEDYHSLYEALLGDGRFLLALTGAALAHVSNVHLVHFMFHDRVAFGGTLLTVGCADGWLAAFPFRTGAAWAWWTYGVSGLAGFASFLSYLGYGYLDIIHLAPAYAGCMLFLAGVSACGVGERQARHVSTQIVTPTTTY